MNVGVGEIQDCCIDACPFNTLDALSDDSVQASFQVVTPTWLTLHENVTGVWSRS
jgi:hypothetical protein